MILLPAGPKVDLALNRVHVAKVNGRPVFSHDSDAGQPCYSHHPPGNEPRVLLIGGEESGVGAPVEEGHAEPLAGADGDVDSELARGLQQAQRQQVRRAHGQSLKGKGEEFVRVGIGAESGV